MGRATIFQGIQQESELGSSFFVLNTQSTEHAFLHFFVVNTDGTAAELSAVQNHVVGAGQCCCR